jgi:tripeptidyl-peptidase-1
MAIKMLLAAALSFAATCQAATQMTQVDAVNRASLQQQGWMVKSGLAPEQKLTLQIGLKQQNEDELIQKLLDVSNRKSSNYGKYLDRDEVENLVGATDETKRVVLQWLKDEGIEKIHVESSWVTFVASVEQANKILAADYQGYERDGISKIRTTQYSVPQDLAKHIDLIHPTTFFGKTEPFAPVHVNEPASKTVELQKRQSQPVYPTRQPTIATACTRNITPACLKQLYNVGNYTPDAKSGSRVAFSSFLNQSAQHEDLRLFLDYFKLPQQKITKVFVNNASDHQDPALANEEAGEANLDAQTVIGVGHPLPVFEILTGGKPPFVPDLEMTDESKNSNEPYLPYYQFLLRQPNRDLPQVISNSYGEPEHTVPKNYASRVCNMIAQLGVRGISIFESSGDTGVGSYCRANDGSNKLRFLPQFPSTCPWLTAVGGTEVIDTPTVEIFGSSLTFTVCEPRYCLEGFFWWILGLLHPASIPA